MEDNGKGLLLKGKPNNIRKFYWILAQEGCHPKATHRILSRIVKNGFDKLTVMPRLNFTWIQKELSTIGVELTFIDVLEYWEKKYDDGNWSDSDLPDYLQKRKNLLI